MIARLTGQSPTKKTIKLVLFFDGDTSISNVWQIWVLMISWDCGMRIRFVIECGVSFHSIYGLSIQCWMIPTGSLGLRKNEGTFEEFKISSNQRRLIHPHLPPRVSTRQIPSDAMTVENQAPFPVLTHRRWLTAGQSRSIAISETTKLISFEYSKVTQYSMPFAEWLSHLGLRAVPADAGHTISRSNRPTSATDKIVDFSISKVEKHIFAVDSR